MPLNNPNVSELLTKPEYRKVRWRIATIVVVGVVTCAVTIYRNNARHAEEERSREEVQAEWDKKEAADRGEFARMAAEGTALQQRIAELQAQLANGDAAVDGGDAGSKPTEGVAPAERSD